MRTREANFDDDTQLVFPIKNDSAALAHPLIAGTAPVELGHYAVARHHCQIRPQGQAEWLLLHCLAGEGEVVVAGQRRLLRANELICIPPQTPHEYAASLTAPWTLVWCHFRLGPEASGLVTPAIQRLRSPARQQQVLAHWSELFAVCAAQYTLANAVCASQLLSVILAESYWLADDQPQAAGNEHLTQAISHMQRHLGVHQSLADLAQVLALPKSTLSRLFHQAYQMGPLDYWTRLRMEKACQQLRLSRIPVKTIAAQLGYADPLYFSRQFKRVIGLAPSQYRAR
ncbi:AraC family transcriptional regulator [Lacticaseibacillus suibinensis]|uniref:AraC family transcriptional regulator n=1 Tax=Lacticaseibacillus suibinensis TaxID=2486011 RepID=UPI0019420811|nr:AraC family transcriptional regulator [Lacticaseibacillus suibinensis]